MSRAASATQEAPVGAYITPGRYLASKGVEALFRESGTPAACYVVFGRTEFLLARERLEAELTVDRRVFDDKLTRRLVVGAVDGAVVALVLVDLGAPILAFVMELMIALGVGGFVLCTTAGAIERALPAGCAFVIGRALNGTGISRAYSGRRRWCAASPALAGLLARALDASRVPHRTLASASTDAFFREGQAEVERWAAAGAAVVEMEAAAAYAVGAHHGVHVCALGTVSDTLLDGEWSTHARTEDTQRRLLAAAMGAAREIGALPRPG